MAVKRGYSKADFVGTVQIVDPDTGQTLPPMRVTSWEGGEITGSSTKVPDWDGDFVTAGRTEISDVTAGFSWGRNPATLEVEKLYRWVNRAEALLTHSLAKNGVIIGATRKFSGMLTGCNPDAGDPGGDDSATLELTFAVDSELLA